MEDKLGYVDREANFSVYDEDDEEWIRLMNEQMEDLIVETERANDEGE